MIDAFPRIATVWLDLAVSSGNKVWNNFTEMHTVMPSNAGKVQISKLELIAIRVILIDFQ